MLYVYLSLFLIDPHGIEIQNILFT
jgi:hypothetical protein